MFRRTVMVALALSAILGIGFAQAQTPPDTTAAPAPAAPDTTARPAPAAPDTMAPPPPKAPAQPAPTKPPLVYYEKARIVVDGQAEANGSLTMTFTPQGAEGKGFSVNVLLKAKKQDVARDIHKELSIAAGTAFKVKLEGEKVRISKVDKKKTPNFAVTLEKLEIGGMSVRVEKD